jgi:hypothetical protein
MAKFKTITIDGTSFSVELDDDGHFRALDDGDLVKAPTFSELTEKLRKRRRRAKVRLSLPITLLGVTQKPDPAMKHSWQRTTALRPAPDTVDATVTGLHAQNRDMLVTLADGTKERMDGNGYSREGIVARQLTAAEKAKYVELSLAASAAGDALDAFVDKVKVGNARQWVIEQVEKAEQALLDAEPPAEELTGDPRLAAPSRKRR